MKNPYFTVLIDNYNHGRLLGDAIRSALAQTYPANEVEVLVVDDGSTDDSRDVILSFKDKVRSIFQPNQGQTQALNRGFAEARGQVVCLLDADDIAHPERLAALADCFKEPEISAAQHYLGKLDTDGRPTASAQAAWPDYFTLQHFQAHQLHTGATSGMAFRRSTLDRVAPAPLFDHYYIDTFLITSSLLCGPVRCVRRELGYWRGSTGHTCLAPFSDKKSQEWEWRMRRFYVEQIASKFAARGVALSASFLEKERQETLRREVLFHAYHGQKGQALSALLKTAQGSGSAGFGYFRALTLSLALISPRLYASFYDLYYRHPAWGALRQKLLPGHS